jgi:dipeptidyl aminopeptidase/acylaminoacyl peptidase
MAGEIVRYAEFKNEGETLRGMLHLPPTARGRVPAVLLCHGFTGHKIEAHRLFVKTSEALAAAGIGSLRFDFRGSGESDGDFETMTVTREISDALAATAHLSRHPGVDARRLGILGLSLGGMVSALVLGRTERFQSAALWSAVCRSVWKDRMPATEWRAWRRGARDIGGMRIRGAFLADLEHQDALGAIARSPADVLVVHAIRDQAVPLDHAHEYERALRTRPTGRTDVYLVAGADHVFSRCDWEAAVIRRTVRWFARTLRRT